MLPLAPPQPRRVTVATKITQDEADRLARLAAELQTTRSSFLYAALREALQRAERVTLDLRAEEREEESMESLREEFRQLRQQVDQLSGRSRPAPEA